MSKCMCAINNQPVKSNAVNYFWRVPSKFHQKFRKVLDIGMGNGKMDVYVWFQMYTWGKMGRMRGFFREKFFREVEAACSNHVTPMKRNSQKP